MLHGIIILNMFIQKNVVGFQAKALSRAQFKAKRKGNTRRWLILFIPTLQFKLATGCFKLDLNPNSFPWRFIVISNKPSTNSLKVCVAVKMQHNWW